MVTITWTKQKEKAVLDAVEAFIQKGEFTCGKSVIQTDFGNTGAIELGAELADLVKAEYFDEDDQHQSLSEPCVFCGDVEDHERGCPHSDSPLDNLIRDGFD